LSESVSDTVISLVSSPHLTDFIGWNQRDHSIKAPLWGEETGVSEAQKSRLFCSTLTIREIRFCSFFAKLRAEGCLAEKKRFSAPVFCQFSGQLTLWFNSPQLRCTLLIVPPPSESHAPRRLWRQKGDGQSCHPPAGY